MATFTLGIMNVMVMLARVLSRIDIFLINSDHWMIKFTGVVVEYLYPGVFDHSPLLLKCLAPH